MGQAIFYIVSAQYLKNQELNKNKNKDEKWLKI
jgi:hypothetical protein